MFAGTETDTAPARTEVTVAHLFGALAGCALVALATQIAKAWPFTVDDAYITLRYSRNVAAGFGPTFNTVTPRAEGYTSLLWMLVLALPHAMHLDALFAAKALGVLATAANLVVAGRWAAKTAGSDATPKPSTAAVAVILLATWTSTSIHAVSGMETALFTLLVTSMFKTAGHVVRRCDTQAVYRLSVLALLVGLTRPEGNLADAAALAAAWRFVPRERRGFLLSRGALIWLLPVVAYQLWRFRYYGLAFPLPWYVKVAAPALPAGWPDLKDWLLDHPAKVALLLLPVLVRPPRTLVPAFAGVALVALFFLFPQHLMGFEHRYLAPLDPTLAVIAATGAGRWLALPAIARMRPRVRAVAAAALVAGLAGLGLADAPGILRKQLAYAQGLAAAHERLGRALFALGLPAGRLALSDAGAVPYLSHWWTLDLIGLNSARIATTGRRDPESVLAEKPDMIVLASQRKDHFEPFAWNEWELPLYGESLRAGFVSAGLYRFDDDYWLWVLARPDSKENLALAFDRP